MTKRTRRTHSPAFKAKEALAAIKGEKVLDELAKFCNVHPHQNHGLEGAVAGWAFGEHRSLTYLLRAAFGGALPARRTSSMVSRGHSMPSRVNAHTLFSPYPGTCKRL